jgi:peroxiredoxin Q/BCP
MLRIVLALLIVIVAVLLIPKMLSRTVTPVLGTDAPDFTLPSQDGSPVSLNAYRGKWVVLYFYPKDQTPG